MNEKEAKGKIGTNIKDYLNSEEMKAFLYMSVTADETEMLREQLLKFGNITAEEHRLLKTGMTNLKKYVEETRKRLSKKTLDFADKKINGGYRIEVIDNYTYKKLLGEWAGQQNIVHIPREMFEDWTDKMMLTTCTGCLKSHDTCDLHTLLLENFVFETGHNLKNCPYASPAKEAEKVITCATTGVECSECQPVCGSRK